MEQDHESTGSHRIPAVGHHTAEIYAATEVPRFRHRAERSAPRYAWLLSLVWMATFIGAALRLIQGIHGWDLDRWNAHDIGDALILLVTFCLTCCLWSAWEREERHPQLLPKKEFERRYPPSTGSPPMPEREYHRRIPYTDDVTQTGSVIEPSHADPDIVVPRWDSPRGRKPTWNEDHPDPMFQRPEDDR